MISKTWTNALIPYRKLLDQQANNGCVSLDVCVDLLIALITGKNDHLRKHKKKKQTWWNEIKRIYDTQS